MPFDSFLKGRGTQVAKGEVCKTFIQGFESPPRLQHFLSNARKNNSLDSHIGSSEVTVRHANKRRIPSHSWPKVGPGG